MSNKKHITSLDIAVLAGVPQATVSRALRGSPQVSDETRQRVEAAAASLHYTVDKNASNLRSKLTGTLALLFSEDSTRMIRTSNRSSCRCSAPSPALAPRKDTIF